MMESRQLTARNPESIHHKQTSSKPDHCLSPHSYLSFHSKDNASSSSHYYHEPFQSSTELNGHHPLTKSTSQSQNFGSTTLNSLSIGSASNSPAVIHKQQQHRRNSLNLSNSFTVDAKDIHAVAMLSPTPSPRNAPMSNTLS